MNLYPGGLCSGFSSCALVESFEFLVEVRVEGVFEEGSVGLLELVLVYREEDLANIVDQLVNPGKVEERLVDSLEAVSVSVIPAKGEILTYNKYQSQILDQRVLQGVLIVLVSGIARGVGCGADPLFYEDIVDEAVYSSRADAGG